jgi:hypothetical protein
MPASGPIGYSSPPYKTLARACENKGPAWTVEIGKECTDMTPIFLYAFSEFVIFLIGRKVVLSDHQ